MAKTDTIAAVCGAVADGNFTEAALILQRNYPFAPEDVTKRRFNPLDYTRVFIRDGFVDRYTGERLVFPPVLRVLSHALPERFPYHRNWRTAMTHPAYWEIGATIDHRVPVTRGGADDESNWVTTSMARNSAKMNWSLVELGWELHPPGDFRLWDGLLPWCVEYANRHPEGFRGEAMAAGGFGCPRGISIRRLTRLAADGGRRDNNEPPRLKPDR